MFSNSTFYLAPELGNGTASMKFFLVNKTLAGITGDQLYNVKIYNYDVPA